MPQQSWKRFDLSQQFCCCWICLVLCCVFVKKIPKQLFYMLSIYSSIIIIAKHARCIQENEAVNIPSDVNPSLWSISFQWSSRLGDNIEDGKKMSVSGEILFNIFNSNADYSLIFLKIQNWNVNSLHMSSALMYGCCCIRDTQFQEKHESFSCLLQQSKKYNLV